MSLPSDVLLPTNAKYHGFVDSKTGLNTHWDITWSFKYALSGTEHGFCTFLTEYPTLSTAVPGQYLGYLGTVGQSYLLDELGNIIRDEYGELLMVDVMVDGLSSFYPSGILAIAFDSTGYFALSSSVNSGVGMDHTIKNSLIVRDSSDQIICNVALSSLDNTFVLASATKHYNTMRFRLSNSGTKLHIEYKKNDITFISLTTLEVSINPDTHSPLYPGFSFCSPISSSSITPSTLFLQNFHVQGNPNPPTYESLIMVPLTASIKTVYTTISSITAIPL